MVVSNQVKKEIISHYNILEEDIEVIYNGVDIEAFNPKNRERYFSEVRKRFDIKSDEKVILFIGTGFERKGLSFLIQAFAILKDAHPDAILLVVGRDNNIQKYIHLSNKLHLSKRVIFTGSQPNVKMFYAAADIFVFPTMYEPFGNVCLEAMASGLPVITSRINGASEIMEGMDYLLLDDPTDIKTLSAKIGFLLANNNDERRKIASAVRSIAEHYTISNNARQFVSLYESILKSQ